MPISLVRMTTRSRIVLMAALVALAGAPPNARSTPSAPLAEVGKCRMFPDDNHWNLRVDDLPVASNSAAIIRSIGRNTGLHPDFGSGKYQGARIGIPYVSVPRDQKKVRVRYDEYGDESDKGPFPIPRNAPVEGGRDSDGDRHVIVVQRGACKLIELYHARPVNGGRRWVAGSGATWDLGSNKLRPKGWTSADAAGLPILPGLARYPEVKSGSIDHALRFTVSETRRRFICPARHYASSSTSKSLPAMGQRLRLKKGYDISGFSRQAKVVLRALKRYGMIVADNGSDWYISGAPHKGWDNDALHELDRVTGKSFVVVDTSQLPRPD
jgi:hypothetical protein